jgi:hypothetical protein
VATAASEDLIHIDRGADRRGTKAFFDRLIRAPRPTRR